MSGMNDNGDDQHFLINHFLILANVEGYHKFHIFLKVEWRRYLKTVLKLVKNNSLEIGSTRVQFPDKITGEFFGPLLPLLANIYLIVLA